MRMSARTIELFRQHTEKEPVKKELDCKTQKPQEPNEQTENPNFIVEISRIEHAVPSLFRGASPADRDNYSAVPRSPRPRPQTDPAGGLLSRLQTSWVVAIFLATVNGMLFWVCHPHRLFEFWYAWYRTLYALSPISQWLAVLEACGLIGLTSLGFWAGGD